MNANGKGEVLVFKCQLNSSGRNEQDLEGRRVSSALIVCDLSSRPDFTSSRSSNICREPMVSYVEQVPEGHRERMRLAEMSFFWHRVYDPRSRTCVHFCDAAPELIGTAEVPALPSTVGGMSFLGCAVGASVALNLD